MNLKDSVIELIRRASTDLSIDVENSLQNALNSEKSDTPAKSVLSTILENVAIARKNSTPICQDTGYLIFYVELPESNTSPKHTDIKNAILEATREATKKQFLRPNAVDPITGKNTGDNVGINAPYIHFSQSEKNEIKISLMLKGGGSENVGTQYKLPESSLAAGRDLKGVKKVIIDAVLKAQGQGCAPGIIGVGIGGDRFTSYVLSKEQFFRKLGSRSNIKEIADLEVELYNNLNTLGIGPMGLGGKTTVLDVFIGLQHRHPATFYVAISYMCWAFRRKMMMLRNGEVAYD
jgi:fumarate hydratase class I